MKKYHCLGILILPEKLETEWAKQLLRSSQHCLKSNHKFTIKLYIVQVNLSELAKTLGYAEGVVPPGKVLLLVHLLCFLANVIWLQLLTLKVVESPESMAMRRMSMENMQVVSRQQFVTFVLIDVLSIENDDDKPGSGD